MDTVMHFGLGLGLAGVAGVRTYFPLIVMGLISRFSETLAYSPPFKIFASVPLLVILAGLAAFELLSVRIYSSSETPVLLNIGFRIIGGAVVFAGLFGGFGIFGGLIAGGLLAAVSYLIMIRLRDEYKNISHGGNGGDFAAGLEEFSAVAGTMLILLLPWTSFLIWGAVILALLKRIRESNRYKPDAKARSWR